MATIVLVHGIAQEQYSAESLESTWLPALAGGISNSENPRLAERIWPTNRRADLDIRMAFYGKVFRAPVAQGTPINLDTEVLAGEAGELTEQLALALLESAANYAIDPADRAQAQNELDIISGKVGLPQGRQAALRPALNALSTISWFTPVAMALAGRFVWRTLTQVTRYLTNEDIRSYAQSQVLQLIDDNTKLVIGHSLGSVVAYEALHRVLEAQPSRKKNITLLTLGSPLGLNNVIYERLLPKPPSVPPVVKHWQNLAAKDDLVAARLELAPLFQPAAGSIERPITHLVNTGSQPHNVVHYLNDQMCGRIVAHAIADP